MSSAQVQSLDRLLDFQASLATYTHHAKEALSSIEMEIRRMQDWLEERQAAWHAEVRRAEEEVFKAKQELARRRLMRVGDRPADTTEQEIALAKAMQRLHHAEEKLAACRRWLRDLPQEIAEYQGRAVNYQTILESDVPRMSAFLDRKMDLLEAYAQAARSDGPRPGDKP
jgi:chromosome segregation ATPase